MAPSMVACVFPRKITCGGLLVIATLSLLLGISGFLFTKHHPVIHNHVTNHMIAYYNTFGEALTLLGNVPHEETALLLHNGKELAQEKIGMVVTLPQEENGSLLDSGKHDAHAPKKELIPSEKKTNLKIKMISSHDHAEAYPQSMSKTWIAVSSQRGPKTGRTRSCSPDPSVCQETIALYGQLHVLGQRPACCHGACVDMATDLANCGSCGRQCSLLQICCNGQCTDVSTDAFNCGRCDHACPSFGPSCQFGMCGYY